VYALSLFFGWLLHLAETAIVDAKRWCVLAKLLVRDSLLGDVIGD
jgi:hypothetical protein